MPDAEFGIVFLESTTERPTEEGLAGERSERPNIRGRVTHHGFSYTCD
jgi:hypothetical protein